MLFPIKKSEKILHEFQQKYVFYRIEYYKNLKPEN